jgi:hypothetical protein
MCLCEQYTVSDVFRTGKKLRLKPYHCHSTKYDDAHTLSREEINDDAECQPNVGQGKPRED